jgi:major membrane immunogen (membrane-anchored lipoprotein)
VPQHLTIVRAIVGFPFLKACNFSCFLNLRCKGTEGKSVSSKDECENKWHAEMQRKQECGKVQACFADQRSVSFLQID